MRTGLFVVAFTAALVAVGCGDTDGPTAPTAPMAAQRASQSGAPAVLPARFDAPAGAGSSLAPRSIDDFNAYDFEAAWDGSMLSLALIEDEMRSMREASKPHRHRRITVGTCPVEPHHALQACGAPIWEGTRRLADRLELPPIPLAECGGWIIVNADELSDDATDGWRNAPCPSPDGESVVVSDGTGEEWPEYPEPEPVAPEPPPPAPPSQLGCTSTPCWILLADSFTAARNLGRTGAGPDADGGTQMGVFNVRWARYYYAEGTPDFTIAQVYSEEGWAGGGTTDIGCTVQDPVVGLIPSNTWVGTRSVDGLFSGNSVGQGGVTLLDSTTAGNVELRDAEGNAIERTPTGYTYNPSYVWTFRFRRTNAATSTRLNTNCQNNSGGWGELYYFDVPLPPRP